MRAGRLIGAIAVVGSAAYPLLVYVGMTRYRPRWVAVFIIAMAALFAADKLRDAKQRTNLVGVLAVPACVISLALASAALDSRIFLLFAPVILNLALLVTFGASLRAGSRPMIERFARMQDPDLSGEKVAWCRTVTVVWCAFFVVNGSIAALLAALAPLSWWAAYTGIVAYALMGALLLGELALRKLRFGRERATP